MELGKTENNILKTLSQRLVKSLQGMGFPLNLDKIDKELTLAGRPFNLTVEEFMGAYIVLIAGSIVLAFTLVQSGITTHLFGYAIIAASVIIPYYSIKKDADTARKKLTAELIDLLYTLELGLSGGVTINTIIEWSSKGNGILAPILKKMVKEVNLGGREHLIFTRIGEEYNIPDAEEIGMVLKHANIHGVEVAESIYGLARDFRYRREHELEQKIVKIKPTIALYVILSFLVASAILMVGPFIAEYYQYLTFDLSDVDVK